MRSDADIEYDVNEEFAFDPAVNPVAIRVTVAHRVVNVTGHVKSLGERIAIKRAAQRVIGIKAIALDIDVKLDDAYLRDDTQIAAAAQNALGWNSEIPIDRLTMVVEDGWITLSGQVNWDFERQLADKALRHLLGVRGMTNTIALKPRSSPIDVADQIAAALKRRIERQAHHIAVSIDGDTVTLNGTVRSFSEWRVAIGAAKNAQGIRYVKDQLTVVYP